MLMSPSAKAHKPGAHHAKDETLTIRVVVAAHRVLVAAKAHIVSIHRPLMYMMTYHSTLPPSDSVSMGEQDVPARPSSSVRSMPSEERIEDISGLFESLTWSQHWIWPVLHCPAPPEGAEPVAEGAALSTVVMVAVRVAVYASLSVSVVVRVSV